MRIFITFFVLFFLLKNTAISQSAESKTDSLINVLETTTNSDSLKLVKFQGLLKHLHRSNDDQILEYALLYLEYAKGINNLDGIACAHEFLGFAEAKKGDNPKALEHFEISEKTFAKIPEHSSIIRLLSHQRVVYSRLGNFEKEEETAYKALGIAKEIGTDDALELAHSTIAKVLATKGDNEKAIEHFDKSLRHAKKAEALSNYANTLQHKAKVVGQKDPHQAIELLREAEEVCIREENDRVLLFVYSGLKDQYDNVGDYKNALDVTYKRLQLAESSNDQFQVYGSKVSLADLHLDLENYDEATQYYTDALTIAKDAGYTRGVAIGYSALGSVEEEKGDYAKAIDYLRKGSALADNLNEPSLVSQIYYEFATAYLENGQPDSAYLWFKNSLGILPKDGEVDRKYFAYNGLGIYHLRRGEYQDAYRFAKQAFDFGEKTGNIYLLRTASKTLYEASKNLNKYKDAFTYLDHYKIYLDSLNNEKNIKKITQLDMQYQFDKEKELLTLEQQQKEALLKAETKQTRTVAFSVGALALLALGFFWNARRKNKTISLQNRQLAQLNGTKDRLFSIIGHDLRKPAIAFRGIAQKVNYLLKKQDYDTLNQLGTSIEKDALALNQLTDNLLNWALTQKDVMPYRPQEIDVADVAAETVSLFEKTAAEKGIQLISQVPDDSIVYADTNALRTILRNLVDNAIKFTPTGGRVNIGLEQVEAKSLKITVTDTGVGIGQEKLKDIFLLQKNKTQRGTADEKGTGLGLHLVHELARLNKGMVEVASGLGQGTRFGVVLPQGA